MSLSLASIAMMALIAGLLGANIAPESELATLPLATMVVGTATFAIPVALIMKKIGRKNGIALGLVIAILGLLLSYFSAINEQFWLFIFASFMIGANGAFMAQGRFMIMENAQDKTQIADGLTLSLMANLLAAIIGPALGSYGKDLFSGGLYSGSFFLAAGLLILALIILLLQYKDLPMNAVDEIQSKRPLFSIIKQPAFILSAGSAAIGYGVMTFVMTATPISMHEVHEHSLNHTRFVIQSHIVAMFLPSLLSGFLIKRGYSISLIITGLMLYILVCAVALYDHNVTHYWWALTLLGIGWNFIYITSTAMLPSSYSEEEKFKAQAANDFTIFTFQAIASFAAGWVIFNLDWEGVISIALFATCLWLCLIAYTQFVLLKSRRKIT